MARAVQQFEGLHRRLPINSPLARVGATRPFSISAHRELLPHLDRTNLWRLVDATDPGLYRPDFSLKFLKPRNRELLTQSIPVFLCPSDALVPGGTNYRGNVGYGPGVFPAKGLPGVPGSGEPGNSAGAFPVGRGVRVSEIVDGLSNTALFSERVMGDGNPSVYDPWRDVFDTGDYSNLTAEQTFQTCSALGRPDSPHSSFWGHTWLFGGWKTTSYNHLLPPNSRIPDCAQSPDVVLSGGDGAHTARSFHAGGVNVACVDGAVRFVNEGLDLSVWRALSTIAGHDVVSVGRE
jgi:hypothetical protein